MTYPLINLRIDNIIAHEVYKRSITGAIVPPKCSMGCTALNPSGKSTMQDRIVGSLGNESHCIEMSIVQDDAASTYEVCRKMLIADTNAFIRLSADLAHKLTQSQTSQNIPGGILVVFHGLVGNQNHKYIGIIKAELHGGFNLQETRDNLLLQYLADLFLTPQQRLYKIALFIETSGADNNDSITPDDFTVLVYDYIMTRSETRQAAKYFYETFLYLLKSVTE